LLLEFGIGLAVAGGVAFAAKRAGSLSSSGAWAATMVGAISVAAGWEWGVLLISWFVASSALTKLGTARKAARTGRTLGESSARNAAQVLANGGVFAIAAFASTALGPRDALPGVVSNLDATTFAMCSIAALGALAAAAADTWSTEIGLLLGGVPRSVLSGRVVEAGLSGGVTLAGSLGGLLGATAVALAGAALVPGSPWLSVLAAGVLGGLADSVLGASVQVQRRCPRCDSLTERTVHDCGTNTEQARGWRWMTNDAVNFCATLVGAAAAVTLANI
jgi:uncharacterized protein (TIGR00297 family)